MDLARPLPSGKSLVEDQYLRRKPDVVGDIEANARLAARAADKDRLKVLYPAPMASAEVVAVAPRDLGTRGALWRSLTGDEGRQALDHAGWRVDGRGGNGKGLPSPGVLQALRTLWHEVAR